MWVLPNPAHRVRRTVVLPQLHPPVPGRIERHWGGVLTMGEPKRIQRKRTSGWRMPEGAVYVGRPTKWGNPWQVGPAMSPAGAVWRYNDAALGRLGRFTYGVPDVATIRAELAGRDLVCWCPLDQPCHADILLELANESPS